MIAKITPTPDYRPDLRGCMDLRDFFEQNTMTGRFRDWIRRRVVPAFEHTAGVLYQYDKYDGCPEELAGSVRELNYYVRPDGIATVVTLAGLDLPAATAPVEAPGQPEAAGGVSGESMLSLILAANKELAERMASLESLLVTKGDRSISENAPGLPARKSEVVDTGNSIEFLLKTHGFSNNHMYEYRRNGVKRSKLYNIWRATVDKTFPKKPAWLDVTKPFEVHLQFGYLEGFDVHNFVKSSIDALATVWGFNDKIVQKVSVEGAYVAPTAPSDASFHLKSKNAFIRYVVKQ